MRWQERITAEQIIVSWESLETEFTFERFFPFKRQIGLRFEFVKGKDNTPVRLVASGFNTNVLYRDRIGFTSLQGEMPFFKEAYSIDEITRQALITASASQNSNYLDILLSHVFDDTDALLESAEITSECMRAQLLSTGTIAIVENGLNKEYDYGYDSSKQYKDLTATGYWSKEGVKPLSTISDAIDQYEKDHKGNSPKYLVINQSTFNKYLRNDDEIKTYFAKLSTPILYPTKEQVKSYIEALFDIELIVSKQTYLKARDFGGEEVDMYPSDRISLIGVDELGNTLYGTTPEEADLASGEATASTVAITTKGIAVTEWKTPDPVNTNVKVSQVCIPTCPQLDKLYIVKVLA
nr:MAG TPA: capsid protein [Caudoviricetes sp.]